MSIKQLIKPSNIKIDDHFRNTFDHSETEVSARWIIMFLRARNAVEDKGWELFPEHHLVAFYQLLRKQPQETFNFNRLLRSPSMGTHYLIRENGIVEATDQFISRIASNSNLLSAESLECPQKYRDAYESACK